MRGGAEAGLACKICTKAGEGGVLDDLFGCDRRLGTAGLRSLLSVGQPVLLTILEGVGRIWKEDQAHDEMCMWPLEQSNPHEWDCVAHSTEAGVRAAVSVFFLLAIGSEDTRVL